MAMTPCIPSRLLGAGAALCLASLVFIPVPPPTQVPVTQSDSPPSQVGAAIEEIEAGTAEAEAEAVAGERGLVASGIPCLMRHRNLGLGVDRGLRHRLAAAQITTDATARLDLLEGLAATVSSGLPSWRVQFAIAETALQSGDTDRARAALDRAAAQKVPAACRADEAFLLANLHSRPADIVAALDRAVAADPAHWAAQEQLALQAARGSGSGPEACDRDAARAIHAAVQLGALAQMDSQLQRLQRALEAEADTPAVLLLRGMVQRQTDRPDAARATWTAGLGALPPTGDCAAALRRALEGLIAATPTGEPT